MQYFGGKYRIASHLVEPIHALLGTWCYLRFVDLFCGSMNVTHRVDWPYKYANDKNKYIVATYERLQSGGGFPEKITEEEYHGIKDNKDGYPDWLVGFVGFGCSFAGKFFGGYARDSNGKNYAAIARRSILRKMKGVQGVAISVGDYRRFPIEDTDLVYCDIPYAGTTGYSTGDFDHDSFYRWARSQDCTILVSEYEHNARGEVIWRKDSRKSIRDSEGACVETSEILQAFNLPRYIASEAGLC